MRNKKKIRSKEDERNQWDEKLRRWEIIKMRN